MNRWVPSQVCAGGTARPRTVVTSFARFADRQQAIKNSSMLKNTHVYINEDLCESSVQLREAQLPELKKTRTEDKTAYFNHTLLVMRSDSSEAVVEQWPVVAACGQATTTWLLSQ